MDWGEFAKLNVILVEVPQTIVLLILLFLPEAACSFGPFHKGLQCLVKHQGIKTTDSKNLRRSSAPSMQPSIAAFIGLSKNLSEGA